jgi:hypothetical protein
MKEITILDNGVVIFDEPKHFLGGFAKAKDLRCGGVLKMVSQARKIMKC